MEFRNLKTFETVARMRSFTRASKELGYVQSAVTTHIKVLETELGVQLFDRLGRNVILTDAGHRLLSRARKILELTEGVRAAVVEDAEPSGTLTVSASETLCIYRLPPILEEFSRRFPEVRLVFHPTTSGTLDGPLRRALSEGIVDAAFIIERSRGEMQELVAESLVHESLVFVASLDHPLAKVDKVRPKDLAEESILVPEKGCGFRSVLESTMDRAGVKPKAEIEFTSSEAIKRCVEAGMGVAALAWVSVADEVTAGKLTVLNWSEPDFYVSTQVVRHGRRWVSPSLNAFLDVTRQVLKPAEKQHISSLDGENDDEKEAISLPNAVSS